MLKKQKLRKKQLLFQKQTGSSGKTCRKATEVASATSSETTNRHEAAEKLKASKVTKLLLFPQTWKQGYKGEGMVVAVIDSGFGCEPRGSSYYRSFKS